MRLNILFHQGEVGGTDSQLYDYLHTGLKLESPVH